MINKSNILKSILKICLDVGSSSNYQRIGIIANNYINKFKYVINIKDDKEYFFMDKNMDVEENEENNGTKNIFELIENSMSDDKLKKKDIYYEAWFWLLFMMINL